MTQQSTTEHRPANDKDLWWQFSQQQTDSEFYTTWLGMVSLRINQTVRAVLVLGEPDSGNYIPVSYWPEGQGGSPVLAELAETTLEEKQGMAGQLDDDGQRFGVAYPIIIDDQLYGVVAVEVGGQNVGLILEQSLRQLRWGLGWIEARLRSQQATQSEKLNDRLITALDLIVSILEFSSYQASIKAIVTELAQRLNCDRVSLGFKHRGYIKVEAISHTVELEKQMNIVRAIGQAMNESFDQCQPLAYPANEDNQYIIRQHELLAQQYDSGTILTIPLYVHSEPIGALTLERRSDSAFDKNELALCRSIATVIAPILHDKQLNDSGLITKVFDSTAKTLKKAFGAEHYLRKAVFLMITVLLIAMFAIDGQYRVTADTVLEGKIQRSIVTPFDSFIINADAQAGDVVKQGQLLAQLEDKDLQLEKLSLLSQHGQLIKQYDEALALRDKAKVNLISAQVEQVGAELKLVDEQLKRTKVTAPFDGLIIQGDLKQSLGSSVAQGDLLFMLAPLNDYRIILQVNERDIQQVKSGLEGTLVLSSLPDDKLQLIVERITPVSTTEEGENYFRVEATLIDKTSQLRPGMEGIAKINVDERSLAWIWSHEVIDWMQLWLWRWLP